MPRQCFVLQVRPDLLDAYTERHAAVWPDMLRALEATGWHHYSIFARPDGLIVGYVESPDIANALSEMGATEVNARWQAEMAPFFVGLDGGAPDASLTFLDEIFNLEDELKEVTS